MKLQISSGMGPAECELAVGKFLDSIMKEFENIIVIDKVKGEYDNTYKSILISSKQNLSFLEGSIKWICESPYRPKHKRKNWFIHVAVINEAKKIEINETLIKYETFRCSGNGGQNVNKVESGARAIYIPLKIVAESSEERTQLMNKKIALKRLYNMISNINEENECEDKANRWKEHKEIVRGNSTRVYGGIKFKMFKN